MVRNNPLDRFLARAKHFGAIKAKTVCVMMMMMMMRRVCVAEGVRPKHAFAQLL